MTKVDFIDRLHLGISMLPRERISEIIGDIHRHFDEGQAGGSTEEELADMLGSPEDLAKDYIALFAGQLEQPQGPKAQTRAQEPAQEQKRGYGASILGAIALIFVDLILVLPLWVSVAAAWIALLASGGACAVAGAAALVGSVFQSLSPFMVSYPAVAMFGGITAIAFGLLLVIGTVWLGKRLWRANRWLVRLHRQVITGRRDDV